MNNNFKFPQYNNLGKPSIITSTWHQYPPVEEKQAIIDYDAIDKVQLTEYLHILFNNYYSSRGKRSDDFYDKRRNSINRKYSRQDHRDHKTRLLEISIIDDFWSSNFLYKEFYHDNLDDYGKEKFSKSFVKHYLSRIDKLKFAIYKLQNIHDFEKEIEEATLKVESFHRLNKSTRTVKSLFKSPEVFDSLLEKLKSNKILNIEEDQETSLDLYTFNPVENERNLSKGKLAVALLFLNREFLREDSNRKIAEAVRTSFNLKYSYESVRKSLADFENHENTPNNRYLNHFHFLRKK